MVTRLSGIKMILGHSWLKQHNPCINWRKGKLTLMRCQCQTTKGKTLPARVEEALDDDEMEIDDGIKGMKTEKIDKGDCIFMVDIEAFEEERRREEQIQVLGLLRGQRERYPTMTSSDYQSYDEWIGASGTKSQELNLEAMREEEEKSPEEYLPPEFLRYKAVFMKESFDQLPPRRPWDHHMRFSYFYGTRALRCTMSRASTIIT